jgi:hypothetical protein
VACVASTPQGWVGPVEVYAGSAPPSCAGAFPTTVGAGGAQPQQAAAVCSTCTCGAPSTSLSSCTGASGLQVYYVGGSVAMSCTAGAEVPWTGACEQPTRDFAMRATVPGSCQASTQMPTIPPPAWATSYVACQAPAVDAGTCASGQVCAPLNEPGFGAMRCIANTGGAVACPPGAYSVQTVVYTGFQDTRDCSPCACGDTVIPCNATVDLFTSTDCSGTPNSLGGSTCLAPNAGGSATLASAGAPNPGQATACGVTQSTATGAVSGTGPFTICCIP